MAKDQAAICRQVKQEYDNGVSYRQGRVKDWQATEELYYGKVKKTLKGRFNVPMPVMSGFVDTLLSKIDEAPILKFKQAEEADFRITKKVQAFYDAESKSEDNDVDSKDLDGKKLAIFSGRAIFKCYAESDPRFRFRLFNTDHYDFYVDPMGGGNLENARYCGEDNVFKSKSQLLEGAKDGLYDKANVAKLVTGTAESTVKDNEDRNHNKASRLAALGLSSTTYNFQGEGLIRFIESGTIVDGVRYYVLWNYDSALPIRCEPLKDVFESDLWWWVSWATHRDSFNFWSKAPADDVRPVAEVIKILANQELDNRQKRNFGQRAYDPEVFPNGAELEYRPNGLIAVRAGASKVQQIANSIFTFETPELNGTINLVDWMDNIIGKKSGVTAATQGSAVDAKVGIYQGNMQQVADRLGLYNKSYVKCHAAIGRRFIWGCYEHLNEAQAVRVIGDDAVEWDELKGKEINPDMDIMVESGSSEAQLSELKRNRRVQAISTIVANPMLVAGINKKWTNEQLLLNGEFTIGEVRLALDTENMISQEVSAKASECIQEIVKGKKPKLFRGATTGFQQKIVDFATENTDGDLKLFTSLMEYSAAHNDIVMENMSRSAMQERGKQGMGPPEAGPPGMGGAQTPGMGAPSAPPQVTGAAPQPATPPQAMGMA